MDFIQPFGPTKGPIDMFKPDPWETFLKRFTYKPGWEFIYEYDIDRNQHFVMVSMRVEDSYHPGNIIPVSIRHRLPRGLSPDDQEDYCDHYLRTMVQDLEMHELDEWFKKDGKLVNDPHALDKINV